VPFLVAYTLNVCDPPANPEYDCGLEHAAAAAASSLHVNVAPVTVAWNVNDAVVEFVGDAGAVSITVSTPGAAAATRPEPATNSATAVNVTNARRVTCLPIPDTPSSRRRQYQTGNTVR
jgi:hypothetical protein